MNYVGKFWADRLAHAEEELAKVEREYRFLTAGKSDEVYQAAAHLYTLAAISLRREIREASEQIAKLEELTNGRD
jgi:hypothetical protein